MAEKQGTLRKKKETGERSHRTSRSFSQKRRAAVFLETLTAESYPKRPLSSGIERSLRSMRSGFPIRSSDSDFHSTVWRRSGDFVLIFGEDQNSRSLPIHIRNNDNIRTRRCTRRMTLTRALTRVPYALSLLFARRPRNLAIHGKREPAKLATAATAVDSRRGRMQGQRGEKKAADGARRG